MFQQVIPCNISGLPGANIINWVITAWLHRYYQLNDPVVEFLYEKILEGPVEHHFVKKPTHNILRSPIANIFQTFKHYNHIFSEDTPK